MSYKFLSKSRLIRGLQCQKSLYLSLHHPDLEPEITSAQQAIFDQGTEVGIVAQNYFPDGVTIDSQPGNPQKAFAETKAAIESGAHTIFEATFVFDNTQVKLDILHKNKKTKKWELIEVKSSTGVKEVYLHDLAIQAWITESCGLKLSKCKLMYLNSECVYPNLENLFHIEDVTKEVLDLKKTVPSLISEIKKMLSNKSIPNIDIGPHCDEPYECVFKEHCWKEKKIPDISIFDLYGLGKKKWAFYEKGILKITDIPEDKLNEKQKRIVNCFITKKRYINSEAILKEVSKWEFPIYYLDFETIAYAIPRFNGTSPYTQVPFQFSCHIEQKNRSVSHKAYLNTENKDPRPEFIENLISTVGITGSVVSYNKGFEAGVLEKLAKSFPKYAKQLRSIIERLVDPLPVIREHVYDTAFLDSFSIKAVAPALLGKKLSYENLIVSDGVMAQESYLILIDSKTPKKEKDKLEKAMLEYCHMDTLAMVELVKWMRNPI